MDESILNDAIFQARLKVYRANHHIQEAQSWFAAHLESDFYSLVDDTDAQTGHQLIRLETARIEGHLVLAIGDAFHCMSSALDYVMSGMMRAKMASSKRISFPTEKTRSALRRSFMKPRPGKKAPSNRRIMEAFPLLVLEVLNVIKPYEGGDFKLWEIRKADNIDKHNLLIPCITVVELADVILVDAVHNNTMTTTISVGPGGFLNCFDYFQTDGSRLEIKDKGRATVSITFSESSEVFAREPVFPTLSKCSQLTAETINSLERLARRYLPDHTG